MLTNLFQTVFKISIFDFFYILFINNIILITIIRYIFLWDCKYIMGEKLG